jgi:hypothetical protein
VHDHLHSNDLATRHFIATIATINVTTNDYSIATDEATAVELFSLKYITGKKIIHTFLLSIFMLRMELP